MKKKFNKEEVYLFLQIIRMSSVPVFNFIEDISLSIGPTLTIFKYAAENSLELYLVFNETSGTIEDLKIIAVSTEYTDPGYVPQFTLGPTHTLVSGSAFESGFQLKIKAPLSEESFNIQVQGPASYYNKILTYLYFLEQEQIIDDLYAPLYQEEPFAQQAEEKEEDESIDPMEHLAFDPGKPQLPEPYRAVLRF